MSCSEPTIGERAAAIADRYNWPREALELAQGVVPEGFPREVSSAISLFKRREAFYDWKYEKDDIFHAAQLVSLRKLLTLLQLAARKAEHTPHEKHDLF